MKKLLAILMTVALGLSVKAQAPVKDELYGSTKTYYVKAETVSDNFRRLMRDFYYLPEVNKQLVALVPDEFGSAQRKLEYCYNRDLYNIMHQMGHDAQQIRTVEGLPIMMLLFESYNVPDQKERVLSFDKIHRTREFSAKVMEMMALYKDDPFTNGAINRMAMVEVLMNAKRKDLCKKYTNALAEFFTVVAGADGVVSKKESTYLATLKNANNFALPAQGVSNIKSAPKAVAPAEPAPAQNKQSYEQVAKDPKKIDPFQQLDELIGLAEVKEKVRTMANLVKIQKMKEEQGMKTTPMSYHCLFLGNPGTGKTTVARIMADIYHDLGILKKGHLVETDRSGLVANYVGQTATKTNAVVDSALGGVLFIDEAYALAQGGGNDYGQEAISTLLKRMEDNRDQLVVILAGYSKEMGKFLEANSGLKSRFNNYINFADYTASELVQIFEYNCKKNDCTLTSAASRAVQNYITDAVKHKDAYFGNARFVRNFFEKTIEEQANRLARSGNITKEMLSIIEASDVEQAINKLK